MKKQNKIEANHSDSEWYKGDCLRTYPQLYILTGQVTIQA